MFGDFLIRFRTPLFLGVLLLTGFSFTQLSKVVVNQDLSKDYAQNNDDYRFFRSMADRLGDEHDFLYIGIHRKAGLFDSTFLVRVGQLTSHCDSLPNVLETQSITNISDAFNTPFGLIDFPFISADNAENFKNDSLGMAGDDRLINRFISSDFKTVVITIKLKPNISPQDNEALISQLEGLMAKTGFEEIHLDGNKYFQVCYNREANRAFKNGLLVSLIALIALLAWLYRSFWGILMPLMAYALGIVNYLGFHGLAGIPLTAASNMFPVILMIATLSAVIHIITRYQEELGKGPDRRLALRDAFNFTRVQTFLTALLVVLGFWTFVFSPIPNMRFFGISMGTGVLISYVVTICILPAALCWLPPASVVPNAFYRRNWEQVAERIFNVISRKEKWVVGAALTISLVGALSIPKIPTNTTMFGSWKETHPLERANHFFETNLAGIRPVEIALTPAPGKTLGDLQVLKEIDKVHEYLKTLPNVSGVFSPVSYFKSFNKIMDVRHKAYSLPSTQDSLKEEERIIKEASDFKYDRIMTEKKDFGKISACMTDPGRLEVAKMNHQIESWIGAHADTSLVRFRLTGSSFMVDLGDETSVMYTFESLMESFFVVGLILLLVFRNWMFASITLLVNITPVFITLSMMAAMHIYLSVASSVIFNVVFVLALDDTIHFMTRYKNERKAGLSPGESILLILRQTAKAMLLTTLLVVAGYMSLLFSNLSTVSTLGSMVCVTSVGSLAADLFLGPWLLLKLDKKIKF
jgi:hypothetical protein